MERRIRSTQRANTDSWGSLRVNGQGQVQDKDKIIILVYVLLPCGGTVRRQDMVV
jgi:hypothetical protein